MPELLRELPATFLFRTISSEGAYTRIAFQPNPSFKEKSYQDRVVHAMAGALLIHTPDMRLCELDAHLEHRVEFGFGILGQLSDETHLFLAREEIRGKPTSAFTISTTKFRRDGKKLPAAE